MAHVIPSECAGLVDAKNANQVWLADILKDYINRLAPQLSTTRVNKIGQYIQSDILHLPPDEQKKLIPFCNE